MRYQVTAECRTCGDEQILTIDMREYEDITDEMVLEELDFPEQLNCTGLACSNCGDIDWNPYTDTITVVTERTPDVVPSKATPELR